MIKAVRIKIIEKQIRDAKKVMKTTESDLEYLQNQDLVSYLRSKLNELKGS